MKGRQVSTGRLVILLLVIALFLLPMTVALAHELASAQSDPADGATVAAGSARATAYLGEELNNQASSTIWIVEAFAGVLVVVGLSEALRRRCH